MVWFVLDCISEVVVEEVGWDESVSGGIGVASVRVVSKRAKSDGDVELPEEIGSWELGLLFVAKGLMVFDFAELNISGE